MKRFHLGLIHALVLGLAVAANAAPLPHEEAPTTVSPESGSFTPSPAVQQALQQVNACRREAGLAPVSLDPQLSQGCQAHARYMTLNANHPSAKGMGAHDEQSGLPGYSKEGARAAVNSVIAGGRRLDEAVDAWMATLYHRVPLLRPNLKSIGLGYAGSWAVLDSINGLVGDEEGPVAYPAANQKNVPTLFPNELPDPIPAGAPHPAGFPITVQFPTFGPEVQEVQAELTDGSGRKVAFHLSTPEAPATAFPQQNTVCLIPQHQLSAGTTYRVTVSAQVEGSAFRKSWAFTTGQAGATFVSGRPASQGSEPAVTPGTGRRVVRYVTAPANAGPALAGAGSGERSREVDPNEIRVLGPEQGGPQLVAE